MRSIPSPRFSRAVEGAPDPTEVSGSARRCTLAPDNPISGCVDGQEEKKTLPGAPADVSRFSYVAVENPNPGAGILTGFPFEGRRTSAHFKTEFPYLLGSTNPCPITVHMEPFPTSVFKVLI